MIPIKIFTDGACKGNPGIGGWAAVILLPDREKTTSGAEYNTTNNRMELMAAIAALESLNKPAEIELFTDSRYVQQGITEWIAAWKARDWRTAGNKPVKNKDLWEDLDYEVERHTDLGSTITWTWVKGHTTNEGNQRADALANEIIGELRSQTDQWSTIRRIHVKLLE